MVTPSQVKKVKIPALNPYLAPQVMCPTCKALLEPYAGKDPDTGQDCILYDCKTDSEKGHCLYTLIAQPVHIQGKCVPTAALNKKSPEEGLRGHARA